MKRIGKWLLLLSLCALLSACGSADQAPPEEESGPRVYYVSENGTKLTTAPCDTENTGEEEIRDLFQTLKNGDFSDGHTAIPEGLELEHTAWQDNNLILYLSGDYPVPGTLEETLCRAVLTLTMLTIEDVDSVRINVNEGPLLDSSGREVGAMNAENFVMSVAGERQEKKMVTLTLYFANETGTALVRETISSEVDADGLTGATVMDMLMKGPLDKSHLATIPVGTNVLGISIRDQICYVNLSDAFRSREAQIPDNLMIYSIVNSLTELPDVDKVQITVNGSADVVFGDGVSVSSPLEADFSLLEPETEAPAAQQSSE